MPINQTMSFANATMCNTNGTGLQSLAAASSNDDNGWVFRTIFAYLGGAWVRLDATNGAAVFQPTVGYLLYGWSGPHSLNCAYPYIQRHFSA